ncbi:hypothetical protein [Acinetobacter sp. ANC 4640]
MLKSIDTIAILFRTRVKVSVQYFSHFLLGCIALLVIVFVYFLSICPIQSHQYDVVEKLAQSAQYPKTQHFAIHLLQQSHLTQWQYFQAIRAYQYEKTATTRYPALNTNDTLPRF